MADTAQNAIKKSLDDAYEKAKAEWGEDNPARLEQLKSHLDTASMAVDHLATEVPYKPEGN
jgi:hypothetical protein